MIVIVDTNAYYGDVYASSQELTALFQASEEAAAIRVWTPRAVVEELVRQFSERAERMRKVLGEINHDLSSFGIPRPNVPGADEEGAAAYRERLEARLTGTNRVIAEHPTDSARIVDWAAQHRHPIRPQQPPKPRAERDLTVFEKRKTRPIFGVVDAAIWLTVIEAAQQDDHVVLVSANSADFADPADKTKPCAALCDDLRDAGTDPNRVEICSTVFDFNQKHVSAETATAQALEYLADDQIREILRIEVSDAVSWIPLTLGSEWNLLVEIDDAVLTSFEARDLELVRADPAPDGLFMTLWVTGDARFDLGIRKSDASGIPEDSHITIYDWDWNESMVAAELEVPARLLAEIRRRDGDLDVSIEQIEPA